MKALIQRISSAQVQIGDKIRGKVDRGILIFLGVEKGDTDSDADYLIKKITGLRIFEDNAGKMNLSVRDIGGKILVVSQFTLSADCRKGTRPSFERAEEPSRAREMYYKLLDKLRYEGIPTESGEFGASMTVHLINDGPVTILLDSRK